MNWYRYAKTAAKQTMILMRGISGTGKSTLAKKLGANGEIFSSDDFFMQNGNYEFDIDQLPKAHMWNQMRVRQALERGVPLVVVDNTNKQFWEMKPYVQMAQEHGYDVEFAEPDWHPDLRTPEGEWNVDFLADKNVHDVPRESVQQMADVYQHGATTEQILKSKAPWEE